MIGDKAGRRRPERGEDDRFINSSSQEERDGEGEEKRKLKKDKGGEETDVMTIDLNRVTLWLILYNSAPLHRRRVSIGAHYRLMNLQGSFLQCLPWYTVCVISQQSEAFCS